MAMKKNGRTLYPMLEKAVTGDDPQVRRIFSFDVRARPSTTSAGSIG
jgi:hypothetical protein